MGKATKGTGFEGNSGNLFEDTFCLRCLLDTQEELWVDSFIYMSLEFQSKVRASRIIWKLIAREYGEIVEG